MQTTKEKPNFVKLFPGKNTIQQMQEIAKYYGGKCLSTGYINNRTNLKWECSKSHQWEAPSERIKGGGWCKRCAALEIAERKKIKLEEMHQIAKERGGYCLSTSLENSKQNLKWKCGKGHIWEACSQSIKNKKSWCPRCSASKRNNGRRLSIKELQEIAIRHGGKCLSTEYVNNRTKLRWECAAGHQWETNAFGVKNQGTWCPVCNSQGGIKEEKVRSILDQLLGRKFKKDRKVLGKRYELDGYNKDLNLAFEYNGEQHYFFIKTFHHTKANLQKRIDRDEEKMKLCQQKGITLLTVPYWVAKTDESLLIYIKAFLKEMNISYDQTLKVVVDTNLFKNRLKKIQEIAKEKGGKCLSTIYHNSQTNLEFECKNGHKWLATPDRILNQGSWCRKCSKTASLSIKDMHETAKKRGGKFLSNEYINTSTKHSWECGCGHQWDATARSVRRGSWCPICGRKKAAETRRNRSK